VSGQLSVWLCHIPFWFGFNLLQTLRGNTFAVAKTSMTYRDRSQKQEIKCTRFLVGSSTVLHFSDLSLYGSEPVIWFNLEHQRFYHFISKLLLFFICRKKQSWLITVFFLNLSAAMPGTRTELVSSRTPRSIFGAVPSL